jgi:putative tricarboxylic transport membrane protein
MDGLVTGLSVIFDPYIMLMVLLGTIGGVIVGILPGIGSTMAIALLLPFTVVMEPIPAIAVLASLFSANAYSGAIPAILVNTPGSGSSTVTCWDGYPLAKRGEAGRALGMATVASGIGGIISVIVFVLAAPALARLAYEFGPPEYFAMYVFGLSMLASIGASSPVKNLVAGAFGILLATVGIDIVTSVERFTFGVPELTSGIQFVPVLVGLFAVSELLEQSERLNQVVEHIKLKVVQLPTREDYRQCWKAIAGSSLIGTFVGILPAAGGTVAALISYNEAKRWSSDPDKFGKGALEGVAAPEAANNASSGGDMVPTLALGIPGSAATGVILAGLLAQGVRPGPHLFNEQPHFVYAIFATMMVSNILCIWMCLAGAKLWSQVTLMPTTFLWPTVFVLAVVGSYSLDQSMTDVYIMLASGLLGYVMRRFDYSPVPVAMGLLLGGLAESSLKQSLLIFDQQWLMFFTRPIAMLLFALTALALFAPIVLLRLRGRKRLSEEAFQDD